MRRRMGGGATTTWSAADGWLDAGPPPTAADLLTPVLVRSVPDQVFERLVTALALGLYPPGQRLPAERELAERLGVSRVTVREALARLNRLGYVQTRRGRHGGSVVSDHWPPQARHVVRRTLGSRWPRFEELFDLAHQLLPVIGRLAAERRTPEDLDRIERARARYDGAPDREACRAADRSFHAAVDLATHNSVLAAAGDRVRAELTLGVDAFPYSDEIRAQASREHREIVAALGAADGERTGALLVAHFVDLAERPLRELHARTAGTPTPRRGRRSVRPPAGPMPRDAAPQGARPCP